MGVRLAHALQHSTARSRKTHTLRPIAPVSSRAPRTRSPPLRRLAMQFKLLGFMTCFGGILFLQINTERIFKFLTKNHDSLVRARLRPVPRLPWVEVAR